MNSIAHNDLEFADRSSDEFGVAVVVLDAGSREVQVSNNNSICRALTRTPEFAFRCARDCGKAYERVYGSGSAVEYECHAGLFCRAERVSVDGQDMVAIVGRTFLNSEGYRRITEKAIAGEFSVFSPSVLFENVLISGSADSVREAADRVPTRTRGEKDLLELNGEAPAVKPDLISPITHREVRASDLDTAAIPAESRASELRSLVGSLADAGHQEACRLVIDHLSGALGIGSALWLESRDARFVSVAGTGVFHGRPVTIDLDPNSDRLASARHLALRERTANGVARKLLLFPAKVGGAIRSAVGIHVADGEAIDVEKVASLVRIVAPQIELLRLHEEAREREQIAEGIRRLNESLKHADREDLWVNLTSITAELLRSERASLLVRDETTGELRAKAAIGAPVDLLRTDHVGTRIASRTFETGKFINVTNINTVGVPEAPGEWRYKTPSFISFPISIGDRRLGVLNFADRADGRPFGPEDIDLLNTIAPQIALAIDRGKLKDLAGELEKRSITDQLTGLMNRGYIDERLVEEMNRASRYRFPASLLMIDVDHFKSYNDSYGHPAGDVALRLVAQVLKRTLRAADVAARYGGEEFAVLLPQTPAEEAAAIADRIRQRIERTEFPKRQVTISVGVAGFSAEFNEPKDWMTAADMALYDAKKHGRNRVINYQDLGRSFREEIN